MRAARAQTGAPKALFEKYNLLGTFARDCSKPAIGATSIARSTPRVFNAIR
jgi:hypothetical protein